MVRRLGARLLQSWPCLSRMVREGSPLVKLRRFPLIAAAALRNRNTSFVIDGEAVLLGVDGRSDFNGLHSRKHDDEVAVLRLRYSW
jgi:hypothetical protein